jgi:mono/diheme cytochrome c family protein
MFVQKLSGFILSLFMLLVFLVDASILKSPISNFDQDRKWIVPLWADTISSPILSDPTFINNGRKIYSLECSVCHGDNGRGDGEAGFGLSVSPGDLNSPSVVSESNGSLFYKVNTGNSPMPGFANKLDSTQIWQVVSYIRFFQTENEGKISHKRKHSK